MMKFNKKQKIPQFNIHNQDKYSIFSLRRNLLIKEVINACRDYGGRIRNPLLALQSK